MKGVEKYIKAGNPPFYRKPEDLQLKIIEYFESGYNTRKVIVGKGANKKEIEVPMITVTGLAAYLGFESRQSFYDYEKNKKFSYIIKQARLLLEQNYEENLLTGNVAGAIFALKNMGWKDRNEVQHKGDVQINVGFLKPIDNNKEIE